MCVCSCLLWHLEGPILKKKMSIKVGNYVFTYLLTYLCNRDDCMDIVRSLCAFFCMQLKPDQTTPHNALARCWAVRVHAGTQHHFGQLPFSYTRLRRRRFQSYAMLCNSSANCCQCCANKKIQTHIIGYIARLRINEKLKYMYLQIFK